jgi:hypothetical protein
MVGMSEIAYVPPQPIMSRDDWPTLGEMIDANKRVVVFMDHGAENRNNPSVDFILPQFQMVSSISYLTTSSFDSVNLQLYYL